MLEQEESVMRAFRILSAVIIVAMVLAACGGAVPAATTAPTQAPAAATVAATEAATVAATEAATTAAPTEAAATVAATEAAVTSPTAAGAATTAAATNWGSVKVASGQTIKIGMGASTSGDTANLGIDERRGAEMAIDDHPEILGHKVELVFQDDLCSGEGGTSVAQKIVSDPQIVGFIGNMCSSSSIAASDIYEQYGIPMVSPSSTTVMFTYRGLKVANTVSMSDATQAATAAGYLFTTLGLKKLAVIHDGSVYGQGIATAVRDDFTKAGGTVTVFEGITVGEKDFRAVLTKIAADKPDAIYFGGFQAEAATLASQRLEVGLGSAVLFTDEGVYTDAFITSAADGATGAYATMAKTSESQDLKDFLARYEKKYSQNPNEVGPYHAHAYDAMSIMIAAIEKTAVDDGSGNLTIDRTQLVSNVRSTTGFKGLTGSIGFNERGERTGLEVSVFQVKSGKWELVK
jgi:branched-chain amino acid transport system substrate-binding protein